MQEWVKYFLKKLFNLLYTFQFTSKVSGGTWRYGWDILLRSFMYRKRLLKLPTFTLGNSCRKITLLVYWLACNAMWVYVMVILAGRPAGVVKNFNVGYISTCWHFLLVYVLWVGQSGWDMHDFHRLTHFFSINFYTMSEIFDVMEINLGRLSFVKIKWDVIFPQL